MKINQQYIKNNNMKQLYYLLKNNACLSRASLAKMTGLSKTTVSSLIDELIQKEFAADNGTASSSLVGRKPNHLSLTGEKHCIAAIYWGPELMTGALIALDGSLFEKQYLSLTSVSGYAKNLNRLFLCLSEKAEGFCRIIGLCIVMPAMLDRENKRILSTVLPLEHELDVVENIRNEIKEVPIAFLNDTACLAYAENPSARQKEDTFAYVNLDQGIGSAFFVDGKLLGGAGGSKTQFGHYSIDAQGITCACGNRGCLEVMIGERALPRLLREGGGSEPLDLKEPLSYADIQIAAMNGDKAAHYAIGYIADNLAAALSNLISLFSPKRIILGGSGRSLGTLFLQELTTIIKNHGFQKMVEVVDIQYSVLGEDACFIGAMEYYFENYFRFTEDMSECIFIG